MTGTVMDAAALAAAWTEAVATVVAVGAAVYAGVYAKKAYVKEVERDERREDDRRAAQAEQIAAWCERYDYSEAVPSRVLDSPGVVGVTRGKREPKWNYFLRNASNVPVYDLVVLFRVGDYSLGTYALDVLPPSDEPMIREVPAHVKREARAARDEHGDVVRPLISFNDAAGRNWRRTATGRLLRSLLQGQPSDEEEDRHEALGRPGSRV